MSNTLVLDAISALESRGLVPEFGEIDELSDTEWSSRFGAMPEFLGEDAAIMTVEGDIFYRHGQEGSVVHELVHSTGFYPEGINTFLNEGFTQYFAELLAEETRLKVDKTYPDAVKQVEKYIIPLISIPPWEFARLYVQSEKKAKLVTDLVYRNWGVAFSVEDDWGNPQTLYNRIYRSIQTMVGHNPYLEYLVSEVIPAQNK